VGTGFAGRITFGGAVGAVVAELVDAGGVEPGLSVGDGEIAGPLGPPVPAEEGSGAAPA
jgi:hypothetical protein